MEADVVLTRFKLDIPEEKWLSVISRKYNDMIFLILSLMPLESSLGNCLLQIRGKNVEDHISYIISSLGDLEHEILGKTREFVLINIKMTDPWILNNINKFQLMLHYPLTIREGKIEFELISTRDKIDSLFNALENRELNIELQNIMRYTPQTILTPRQEEVLQKADDLGYYNIPRDISLSHLAKKLGISPSALSELLRRTESRLAKVYLYERGLETEDLSHL